MTRGIGIQWHYVALGKVTQNAFIESLNGRFRDEWLNKNLLENMHHMRQIIEDWRTDHKPNNLTRA